MTIKVKLLGNSALNVLFLFCVLGTAMYVFGNIGQGAEEIQHQAGIAQQKADEAHATITKADEDLASVVAKSQSVSSDVTTTNAQMKILRNKVVASSESLTNISILIEEALDTISDEEVLNSLYDVADEVGDLQEIMKREALVSLQTAVESMDVSTENLASQVSLIATASEELNAAKAFNEEAVLASQEINKVSVSFLSSLAQSRNVLIGLIAIISVISFVLSSRIAAGIIRPLQKGVVFAQAIATGDLTQRVATKSKDEIGDLIRALNDMSIKLNEAIGDVATSATTLVSASGELSTNAGEMSTSADEMDTQSNNAAAAVEELSANLTNVASGADNMSTAVSTVASAIEEMSSSLIDVAKNCVNGSRMSSEADGEARKAKDTMSELNSSATEIGKVVEAISDIADQTNLLALNASIEAASAGESGKGFAVVANEVKELAKQTAQATEEIGRLIYEMQGKTGNAVAATDLISNLITDLNNTVQTIASTVEQQSATTNEIAQSVGGASRSASDISLNLQEASTGSTEVSRSIQGLSSASDMVKYSANQTNTGSDELAETANSLGALVGRFQIEN